MKKDLTQDPMLRKIAGTRGIITQQAITELPGTMVVRTTKEILGIRIIKTEITNKTGTEAG